MGRNRGVILQWTFLGAKVSRHYKGHSGVIKKWTLDAGDIAIFPYYYYLRSDHPYVTPQGVTYFLPNHYSVHH